MRSLRFVFVVVVLCLPAIFVGGGQVSAQTVDDIVYEQRTVADSIHGGPRIPQPYLSTVDYPRSNLALNADNATVSSARASYDVGYIGVVVQASTAVGQLHSPETTFDIPRGWTVGAVAAAVDGGRRFLSWECDADGHDSTVKGAPSSAFERASADNILTDEANVQFLPYARELIETKDIDGSGSIDQPDETRKRCIAPGGLTASTNWETPSNVGANFTYAAYTPTDDWEITPESMATPVYIVPTEPLVYMEERFGLDSGGTRGDRDDYNVPISGTFRAEFSLETHIVRVDRNGLGAISATCTGARDSAESSDTSDFCLATPVSEPVIADGDLPTFGQQPSTSASLVNCGFAVNNQCRDISSNAEASAPRTLAANTVHDFVLKPRSDTTLSQVELALGVPFVGAPPNSADSTITVELARDYTARAGYTVGTVTAAGTSTRAIDENDVELALKPCSATSTETCLEITLNSVYVTAALANPIYAITVTNTGNQQNTIYTR